MGANDQDDLTARIAEAQAKREARKAATKVRADAGKSISAGAMALRYSAEFGVAIFVGGFLGWLIDYFAGTEPWGLLAMGAFGFAAGVRNMVRAYHQLNADAAAAAKTDGAETPPDDGADTP